MVTLTSGHNSPGVCKMLTLWLHSPKILLIKDNIDNIISTVDSLVSSKLGNILGLKSLLMLKV